MFLGVLLVMNANIYATTMDDSRAFFAFDEKAPGSGQYAAGDLYETAGVNTATVNIGATSSCSAQSASGTIGLMDPDGIGAGFWSGGSLNFGTGLSNEFNLAGASGMSIVWRMSAPTADVRWGNWKNFVVAGAGTEDQYWIGLTAYGSNEVRVGVVIKGATGWSDYRIDMASEFNMLQWATYAITWDGATGNLTFHAWGDDGDYFAETKSVLTGTIGAITAGNPSLGLCVGDYATNGPATATGLSGSKVDGLAIFDTALTKTQVENLIMPEPATMVLCMVGGGFMLLKRRGC
jgi:hypothetical protein